MEYNRTIKSYVLRQGRFTKSQKYALENHWAKFGINYNPQTLDFFNLFGNHNPVFIEIGFGNGEFLLNISENNPNRNFLGIEVYKPGVGRLLNNLSDKNLKNVKILNFDAIEVIKNMVNAQSLQGVYIMFPDPWHKKKHHKRRIIKDSLLKLLADKIVPGGLIFISTDWEDYAQQISEVINKNSFNFHLLKKSIHLENFKNLLSTKYERRGLHQGHRIKKFVLKRI
tara:strand:+ start:586 stop:1263 length:678 start_codon:yes stop_codon:yes gene_type:complete